VFHVQYGRFYQKPDLADLYLSPFYLDTYVSTGGYFTTLDNPSLKPEKTTSYEIGFKHMLGMNTAIQLTAFYKETEDLVRERNIQTDLRQIAFTFNEDFGVVKGFDVILTLRRTRNLSATINYEYQTARGTGTSSSSMHQIAWQDEDIPKFVMPLEFEQKHTGTVNVDYRLRDKEGVDVFGIHPFENTGINLLFSFNSGRPYTGKMNLSQLPHAGRYDNDYIYTTPSTPISSEMTPWNYRFDLKVDKSFKLPFLNAELKAFIWVLNLLNTETVTWVWPVTGLPNESGFMQTTYGQDYYENLDPEAQKAFDLREMDYCNYGIPRQIRGGLMISF
jgi:outer membrane receptor protein involved in Fe transport